MRKAHSRVNRIYGPAYDSVLLALIQIVTYVTNMVTTKMLSIELSLMEYGTYSTVNTIITIAASLTLFGLGDSINYYYNKKASDEETTKIEYVNTIFFLQLLVGVIVGLVLILCSKPISNYYNNAFIRPLVLIVCIKPWISNATHLYQVLFVSCGRARIIAIRNLIISLSKVVFLYVSVTVFESLSAVFICLVLLDIAQLVFFKYFFGKINFEVKVFAFRKEKLLPVIKYTIPMGVFFVTTTLMREIDKLVVGRCGTTEELAIYANCAKTLPLNILITSFATVLTPYIMKNVSGKNYKLTTELLRRYLTIGYLSVWMFSGALLLCAPEAIRFFYSNEYVAGLPIFVIYLLDGMIQFASVHLVIAANGDLKFLMKTSLSLLCLNIISSLLLYKMLGIWNMSLLGPAIATVLISGIYVSVLYRKTSQILQVKIREFLPVKSMIVYLVELLLLGVVFWFIKKAMILLNVFWVIILISICASYCLIAALLNFKHYKKLFEDINQLKR